MKIRHEVKGVKEGTIIGRRTVLGDCFYICGRWLVVARCKCGHIGVVNIEKLLRGLANSCGCLAVDVTVARDSVKAYMPLFYKWDGMNQRCHNPNHSAYGNYGARGIAVCDEWRGRHHFVPFRDWALANGWTDGLDIDRIDNSKGYSPDNCRFVKRRANLSNRRNTMLLTAFGETKPLMEWLSDPRCRVNQNTLRKRLYILRWPHERALSSPPAVAS